jgi:spermidine/putrescine transport system substrate-binding protein
MKRQALTCASVIALSLSVAGNALAADLTYYTWAGYELPEFHAPYKGDVDIITFADDNDALAKVRSGFRPDVAHPCTFKLDEWKSEGLLQPVDTSRVKNWDGILPSLKDLPGVIDPDGTVWMVPWDWGNTSVIYRTDLVTENTDSWSLLWDKTYAGRLATLDASDTPIVAAMLIGVDPFKASEEDVGKIGEKLREQRPLLRFYTADQASLGQALASGELVAAMGWQAAFAAVKATGASVAYMQPKEGMLTWACGMVLMKGSEHVDAAYDFINARLDPASQKSLISEYGYGGSLQATFDLFTPEELEAQSLPTDPDKTLSESTILQPQQNADKIIQEFEAVKAGG